VRDDRRRLRVKSFAFILRLGKCSRDKCKHKRGAKTANNKTHIDSLEVCRGNVQVSFLFVQLSIAVESRTIEAKLIASKIP